MIKLTIALIALASVVPVHARPKCYNDETCTKLAVRQITKAANEGQCTAQARNAAQELLKGVSQGPNALALDNCFEAIKATGRSEKQLKKLQDLANALR